MRIGIVCVCLMCSLISSNLSAQFVDPAPHGFSIEAGGATSFVSINYFRRIFNTDHIDGFLRAGVGGWSNNLSFPFGIFLQMGNSRHGGRLSLVSTPHSNSLRIWDRAASDIMVDLVLGLEYVYQFPNRSVLLSAGAFPYVRLDPGPDLLPESSTFTFRPGLSFAWILR